MVASQIRQEARNSLTGKWGKAALMTLVFFLITFGINFALGLLSVIPFLAFIARIASYAINVPLSYGLLVSFMKLKRGEDVDYTDFFNTAFSKFSCVWGIVWHTILKMLLLIVLLIIFLFLTAFGASFALISSSSGFGAILSGIGFIGYLVCLILLIPKSYLYSLTFYLLHDNPNMTSKDIVEKSESLMLGTRWNLFYLGLTFIGWAILSVFTLYIGLLWLYPYIIVSMIVFYEKIIEKSNSIEDNKENDNPIQEEK